MPSWKQPWVLYPLPSECSEMNETEMDINEMNPTFAEETANLLLKNTQPGIIYGQLSSSIQLIQVTRFKLT